MEVYGPGGSAYGNPGQSPEKNGLRLPGWKAVSWLGKGFAAAGSIMEGEAQEDQFRATAQGLDEAARAKREQAKQVREQSLWESIRMGEEGRRVLSTQRAIFGEAGVTMEGAPETLQQRTETEMVRDKMVLAYNTGVEMTALRREARSLNQQANAYNRAAGGAENAGLIGAFASFF